jgi:hypothetical protein
MQIELEQPFSQDWKKGYLVESQGRRSVCLYNNREQRKTISYARYLMSVKMVRYLLEDEHVDHIDNNCYNDCIENLQILTRKENRAKYKKIKTYVEYQCPICAIKHHVVKRKSHLDGRNRKTSACSRPHANMCKNLDNKIIVTNIYESI